MTEMCKKYFPASNETSRQRYPKMYSSDRQRFLYCIVPKVERRLRLRFHFQYLWYIWLRVKGFTSHSTQNRSGHFGRPSFQAICWLTWLLLKKLKFVVPIVGHVNNKILQRAKISWLANNLLFLSLYEPVYVLIESWLHAYSASNLTLLTDFLFVKRSS